MNNKKLTLVSVAFQKADDDSIQLRMARPCADCTMRIARSGIKKIIYSTNGGLIKVKIDQLMKEALPSSGFRIYRIGNPVILPRLYIRNERTFDLLTSGEKSVEARLNKGFTKSIKNNDIIEVMYQYDIIKMKVIIIKRYKSFRQLLMKESIKKTCPDSKDTPNPIVAALRHIYTTCYPNHKQEEKRVGVLGLTLARIDI